MRIGVIFLLFCILLLIAVPVVKGQPSDGTQADHLIQGAKLALFEEDWEEALQLLDRLQAGPVSETHLTSSLFYEARALEGLNRPLEAIESYQACLARNDASAPLREESRYAIVRLSALLYRQGNNGLIENVLSALTGPDPGLRFVAALQLSYLEDPSLARQAVSELRKVFSETADDEIRNQAALALLRIDPELLDSTGEDATRKKGKRLNLSIRSGNSEEFKLSLPLSLARMVFQALPESARSELRSQGIHPETLLEELAATPEIFEIEADGEVVRLWID